MAKTYDELLKEIAQTQGYATPEATPAPQSNVIDDGGFTRNVLMAGIPGMEQPTPNFTGKDGKAFLPGGIVIDQNDLPPSPVKPELQALTPPALQKGQNEFIKQQETEPSRLPAPKIKSIKVGEGDKVEQPEEAPEQPPVEQEKPLSPLQQLLAKYNQPEEEDSELKAALDRRNEIQKKLMILDGLSQIGAGIGGYKHDKDLLAEHKAFASRGVEDLQALRKSKKEKRQEAREEIKFGADLEKFQMDMDKAKMQMDDEKAKRDPNSEISQLSKRAISNIFVKIGQPDLAKDLEKKKLSHAQLEDLYGQMNMQNYLSMYEAQQTRLLQAQMAAEARKAAQESKAADARQKRIEDVTKDIRRELISGTGAAAKAYSNYLNADRSYKTIQEYLKDPSGYTDYASIMGALKALQGDESVVREAEVRMGMQATSLPNAIKNWTSKMSSGKMLQPQQRRDMAKAVEVLRRVAEDQFRTAAAPALEQARVMGLDEKQILPTSMLQKPESSGRQIVKKEYSKSRNQTRITYSDGTQEILDGRQ